MSDKVKDSFMSMFKMIDPNGKYVPAKIAEFYYIVGGALVYNPIKNLMGDIDMRYSHGICITSGRGKDAIKNVAFVTAEAAGLKYSEFTSLHEEQLVGKKWKDAKGKDHKVLGYFADTYVEKDDGLLFINGANYELARNYWLRCLNPYGKNLISKKLVEDEEDGLKYPGTASLRYFIQTSEKIKEKNLTSGLFRRCPILRIDLTREEEKYIKNSRLLEEFNPEPAEFEEMVKDFKVLRNIRYSKLNSIIINRINEECDKYESENMLLNSLYLENQNCLVKWSYINALIRLFIEKNLKSLNPCVVEVLEEDLEKAIDDYKIVYGGIRSFVEGNAITNSIQNSLLNYIRITEKTMTSPEVISAVAKILDMSEDKVRPHFYKLKSEGLINTKQLTKRVEVDGKWLNETTSEVWL